MNEESAGKVLFTLDDKFKFSCHGALACFNKCCRDINIFLTPYDVLRMRKATGLSSQEFLDRYTIPLIGEEGLPLVVLKMREDEEKTCRFVGSAGCSIYPDRPWACRMYPVFPVSSEQIEFVVEERASCDGFMGDNETTIRDWKRNQGIATYDEMNKAYKEITYHDFFEKGGKLDRGKTKLVYGACYDLDSFRKFLFETRFFKIYDVAPEVIEKIREDDEELLNFGYKWVRFSLFSEDTLRLKDKKMDGLLQARGQASK